VDGRFDLFAPQHGIDSMSPYRKTSNKCRLRNNCAESQNTYKTYTHAYKTPCLKHSTHYSECSNLTPLLILVDDDEK